MARNLLLAFMVCGGTLFAQSKTLDIYWIDTEGGASTLIVTPGGQALLVDTGNPGPDDRDAKRVFEVTQKAGLKKIDYLVTTHYHGDHVGGAPALAKLIPIEHFYDHGESVEAQDARGGPLWQAYKMASAGKRSVVKPGDKLPLRGLDVTVVSADSRTISAPINGGGPNPFCEGAQNKPRDKTENQRSVGLLLTFGKFRFLDLGDLTWDVEMDLACPVNKLGQVTLYQATHHGFVNGFSGAPAQVWALKPQVVVVNNGPMKGWDRTAWDTVSKIQGLEGVWQSHLSLATDAAHNTRPEMIANLEATDQCKGQWLKASVSPDGKFTMTNGRTGFSKTYTSR